MGKYDKILTIGLLILETFYFVLIKALPENAAKYPTFVCGLLIILTVILGIKSFTLKEKYEGKLPIWVATEIMTFGMLSKLYSNMLPEDTRYIKNNLCRVNTLLVKSWLQSLTQVRNQCAHYGRIYNNNFRIITIKNEYKKYNLDNKKIFSYILAMKHLTMDKLIWNSFFIKLQKLINDYNNSIDLKLIGFPNNWIEILAK